MTTDYNQAYDLITAELQTYWAANAGAIVTPIPALRFANNEVGDIPKTYFVRFLMTPVSNHQSSFRQTDGKRYREDGLIYCQVFSPRADRTGYAKMRQLSMLLRTRLRKRIDCISFNNVRIVDAPSEDSFLRQNVIAEYWFDELQG